ncbi:MAG: hypothetical protein BIFFINMI_03103 [Phycisphaerae bacterium]|nr:hypothetical protein [Phycisphaerae bacterium]
MWPFRKKQGRRLEAARARAELRAQRWRQLREAGVPTGIGIGLLFAVAATVVLLLGGQLAPYHLGQKLAQPLVAQVEFDMPDPADPGATLHVNRGDQLANPGVIDEAELLRLRAAHNAYVAHSQESFALRAAGIALLVLLVTAGLALYIHFYQTRVIQNPSRTIALALLLLLTLLATRATVLAARQSWMPDMVAAGMVVLSAMALTIAYNQRFALGACWFTALLVVPAANQDFDFLVLLLGGILTATLMLNTVRSRTKLVIVGLTCAGAMMLISLASGLIGGLWLSLLWRNAMAAGAAGLAAGLVMQGVLPLIERAFNIATAMTLLEWSDVSKPLLRRLATEAPGTFNHSLLLGTLAEAAAEAIDADGLLARVGAYYHDIGKINKPPYFVENQEGTISRHDKLSPAMSLLIILGHVKDGLEMAKEYNVPRVIWPFITEHHGTTLIEYFYHAAKKADPDKELNEAQFRYPGPRPQSKETAILMLCDGVEGATRALSEPNAARIEDLVHRIARKRLDDGQLEECNLTLRELKLVEQSLTKSLLSFYHGRIQYPASAGKGEPKAVGKPA